MKIDECNAKPNGLVTTITTGLAATLNMAIVVFLCFVVMPSIERCSGETEKNRHAIAKNHRLIEENLALLKVRFKFYQEFDAKMGILLEKLK